MNNDLINRQWAIASAMSGRTRIIDGEKWIRVKEARESLTELPSANTWIPTAERLPETEDAYLVTVHPDYIVPSGGQIDILTFVDGKWMYWDDGAREFPDPIIAWMPRPLPYKL